ncbi:zinc finger, CCHC-type containing protein [Tanacetum coccineum]
MDDPNITMEEYIRLEEEKAQRHGRTFNWQTATFGKVENHEDEDYPPNKNKIDFRISLDESNDEDYMVIFNENSFSYKIISVNDLKKDSENDEILKPSSSEFTVDCLDDLDYFKYFKNEFPAIVYNDGLTSKSYLKIEPRVSSGHINKLETSLSKYDEEERNALPVTFPDNLKTIKDSDDNIDITQPSRYMAPLPHRNLRHPWLRYQIEEYTEDTVHDFERRLETIWDRSVNRVHILDFEGLTPEMRQDLAVRLRMVYTGKDGQQVFVSHAWRRMSDTEMGLDVADTLCFQLGCVRRRMIWTQFILALGLHTEQEMAQAGFGAYWTQSERIIPDKGDLRDYWIEISFDQDFLGSMDRGTANVPYLFAQYLFRHAEGRKSGARLSRGYFIGRLADHFGLVSDEGLRVEVIETPMYNLEPITAQCPKRPPWQQVVAVGAHEAGPAADKGA